MQSERRILLKIDCEESRAYLGWCDLHIGHSIQCQVREVVSGAKMVH